MKEFSISFKTELSIAEVVALSESAFGELTSFNLYTPEALVSSPQPVAPVEQTVATATLDKAPTSGINASPAAIALADDKSVDLSKVTATGKDDAVTKADVQRHIKAAALNGIGAPASANNNKTENEQPAGGNPNFKLTADDIRAKLREVIDGPGSEAAKNLFNQFNALNVSMLFPEQYADFIAAADQLIAAR